MLFKSNKKLNAAYIRTGEIRSGEVTRRRFRDEEKLAELQNSILSVGIIEPLHVSRVPGGYVLISGERRLEAARRLGLKTVPAVIEPKMSESDMLVRAFIENAHKEDFSIFEQAAAIRRIMTLSGKNNAETATLLGIDEDLVKARLKLLILDEEAMTVCEAAGLSEKWVNRIVAMPQSERGKLFFGLLNEAEDLASRACQLRERLQLDSEEAPVRTVAIKDVRIFFNTIDRAIEVMKHAGVEATTERHDFDGLIEYYIRIPSRSELARR